MAQRQLAFLVEELMDNRPQEIVAALVAAGRSESDFGALAKWFDTLANSCRAEAARLRYEAARPPGEREED